MKLFKMKLNVTLMIYITAPFKNDTGFLDNKCC